MSRVGGEVWSRPEAARSVSRFPATVPRGASKWRGPSGSLSGGAMMYAEGVYENTYVKESGAWKIAVLFWVPTYYVSHDYNYMWFRTQRPAANCRRSAPTPPVEALGRQFMPFHYVHPITGAAVTDILAKDRR